jgi:hypothetical protein
MWYDLNEFPLDHTTQGIYILLNPSDVKLGKTSNPIKTKSQYERSCANAQMIFIPTDKMDKVETIILNLLVGFRIKKNNSSMLTEVIKIDLDLLKKIVEFSIEQCDFIEDENLCRSTNTISNIKIINNNFVITELIKQLVLNFNTIYSLPMELDDGCYSYFLNYEDLCKYIYYYLPVR